jgi:hypothetical protein
VQHQVLDDELLEGVFGVDIHVGLDSKPNPLPSGAQAPLGHQRLEALLRAPPLTSHNQPRSTRSLQHSSSH